MSKRRSPWNEQTYRKYLKEGRGQGTGDAYVPWIKIHDFASQGIVSRVFGITTGRVHHLMSKLELGYFYILDWSDLALDIREQFPLLDMELAMQVAREAGIRYPVDRASGLPYVMSTDFVITTHAGDVARSVKPSKELARPRVLEKLEIERRYWTAKGIDWKIVTEKELDAQKIANIEWARLGYGLPERFVRPDVFAESEALFLRIYEAGSDSIDDIARSVEEQMSLPAGTGRKLFQHLVLCRKIIVDMETPILFAEKRGAGSSTLSGGG